MPVSAWLQQIQTQGYEYSVVPAQMVQMKEHLNVARTELQ